MYRNIPVININNAKAKLFNISLSDFKSFKEIFLFVMRVKGLLDTTTHIFHRLVPYLQEGRNADVIIFFGLLKYALIIFN